MDRFIVKGNAQIAQCFQYLKSNMDRFIVSDLSAADTFMLNLKSNMDRFIVCKNFNNWS